MARRTVILDTCFLIALVNSGSEHHGVAKKYHKYFIEHEIAMLLSPVVISEFHQKQTIVSLMNTKNYMVIPFNYHDALATADISFQLGMSDRVDGQSKAEFKDDLKILGQARTHEVDYIITEDEKTLATYINRLQEADLMDRTTLILLKDGFQESSFNDNGQTSLIN